MALKTKQVTLGPTDGSGNFSVNLSNLTGRVAAIAVDIGDLSTPDIAVTDLVTGDAILSVAGVAADTRYQPKIIASDPADGSALDTAGDVAFTEPVLIRGAGIAVSGAGAARTGVLYLVLES